MWTRCRFFSFSFYSLHFWSLSPKHLFHSQTDFPFQVKEGASSPQGYTLPYSFIPESLFMSIRKREVSLVPLIEGGLFFPEDSETVSDWVIYPYLNPSVARDLEYCDFFGSFRPTLQGGANHTLTPGLRTGEGYSLTGSQRSGKWMLRTDQSTSITSFPSFPSLSFSPSFLLSSMATNMRTHSLPLRPFRVGREWHESNNYSNGWMPKRGWRAQRRRKELPWGGHRRLSRTVTTWADFVDWVRGHQIVQKTHGISIRGNIKC